MKRVIAIVPAAGLSTRFGGPNKLLEPFESGTVVGTVAATLTGCGIEVLVVTGRDSEAVARAVTPCRTVFNPQFREGLGTSIASGVRAVPEADGYLVALGDMPALRAEVVEALLRRYEALAEDAIMVPVYDQDPDRHGHPVLFGSAYRRDLESLKGDEGAKAVIQRSNKMVRRVHVTGSLKDLDSPDETG